ncbi:MAG: hypothetical protein LC776_14105 [Acidobacteria bacterium]|nr:hypothetical protein [Acidobacteriota bacterium]
MEPSGEPQVHRIMHQAPLAGEHRLHLTPIVLQLHAWRRLEAHRRTQWAKCPLWPDVVLQDADAPGLPERRGGAHEIVPRL